MNTHTTSRRGALGALGAGASLLAGVPAVMAAKADATTATDPKWIELVAAYRETRVRWQASVDAVDKLEVGKAMSTLPPKPEQPATPRFDKSMTLEAILASTKTPQHEAAWADYEEAMAAWDAQRADLRERLIGDAERAQKAAWEVFSNALDAMAHYRVSSLSDLHQKTVLLINEFRGTDMEMEYLQALAADMLHLGAQVRS